MIIRSEYFHKHGLKIRDKIVIASKEVLKDNKTVHPLCSWRNAKICGSSSYFKVWTQGCSLSCKYSKLGMGSNLFQKFNYSQL